jgi:hypothetical protein
MRGQEVCYRWQRAASSAFSGRSLTPWRAATAISSESACNGNLPIIRERQYGEVKGRVGSPRRGRHMLATGVSPWYRGRKNPSPRRGRHIRTHVCLSRWVSPPCGGLNPFCTPTTGLCRTSPRLRPTAPVANMYRPLRGLATRPAAPRTVALRYAFPLPCTPAWSTVSGRSNPHLRT